jgi:hypothetical protein
MLAHALCDIATRYSCAVTSVAAEDNVDGRAHDLKAYLRAGGHTTPSS